MTITTLTPNALRRAANIKERIDALQDKINEFLGTEVLTSAAGPGRPRKKHKMSRAGRAAIAAAARARWAKYKRTGASAKPGRKPKRKMSAAGRARLAAAVRARWKKAKAAGKTTL
jgi:hypothetical protein